MAIGFDKTAIGFKTAIGLGRLGLIGLDKMAIGFDKTVIGFIGADKMAIGPGQDGRPLIKRPSGRFLLEEAWLGR